MEGIRENARRRCGHEDREMRVVVARDFGEEPNRSHHDVLNQAARRNVSTRKGGHQDRIPRRSQAQCNAGRNWSTTGILQDFGIHMMI